MLKTDLKAYIIDVFDSIVIKVIPQTQDKVQAHTFNHSTQFLSYLLFMSCVERREGNATPVSNPNKTQRTLRDTKRAKRYEDLLHRYKLKTDTFEIKLF